MKTAVDIVENRINWFLEELYCLKVTPAHKSRFCGYEVYFLNIFEDELNNAAFIFKNKIPDPFNMCKTTQEMTDKILETFELIKEHDKKDLIGLMTLLSTINNCLQVIKKTSLYTHGEAA